MVLRHQSRAGIVVVAVHSGELVPTGTLKAILAQAGLSAEELRSLLLRRHVRRRYTIVLVREPEEETYSVLVPALPGCFTFGRTVEECTQRAQEAIEVYIESLKAHGESVPEEKEQPQTLTVTVAA